MKGKAIICYNIWLYRLNYDVSRALGVVLLLFLCCCEDHHAFTPDDYADASAYDCWICDESDYLAFIGDTQTYTNNGDLMPFFLYSMAWIEGQAKNHGNVSGAVFLGDMTENNQRWQWDNFLWGKEFITACPTIGITGNHDYEWGANGSIESRESSLFNEFFYRDGRMGHIVARFDDGMENVVACVEVGEERLYVMALEFGPRPEVVAWAKDVVESACNERFILVTHEWILNHRRVGDDSYATMQFSCSSCCTPEYIWNVLVKPYDNIVATVCGHNGFSEVMYSQNDAGRMVPQILFNLQYQDNGGNGYVEMWEFPSQSDSVIVAVYDTFNRKVVEGDETVFKFRYKY